MGRRAGLMAVLLGLGPLQAQGGFLDSIQHSVTHSVSEIKNKVDNLPVPIQEVTPEQITKAMQEHEIVSTLEDSLNRSVNEVVSSAQRKVVNPLQDLSQSGPNMTQVLDATAEGSKHIADAVLSAGASLSEGAAAVSNVSSATTGSLQDTAPGSVVDITKVLDNVKPDDIAAAISGAAPEVASALNKTGLRIAKVIEGESPKVAAQVNRTSAEVTKMFGVRGPQAPPLGSDSDGDEGAVLNAQGAGAGIASSAPWWLAAVMVAPLLAGVVVYQKFRRGGARPGLLSDSEMGDSSGSEMASSGPLRLRAEPAAREPLFQKF